MGPTALFDKSFLEMLNPDESLWFDHYFHANICPVFFVETLADLEKEKEGRTPEQLVANIANKFPAIRGWPNVSHYTMCLASLLGRPVPMNGQIQVYQGDRIADGENGFVHHELSLEGEAFSRWKRGQFLDVERAHAQFWRQSITGIDLEKVARQMRAGGMEGIRCKTAEEAHAIASQLADRTDVHGELMQLLVLHFCISPREQAIIQTRWTMAGLPPLSRFAPYAHYALTVELFLRIAVANDIVAPGRATNRIDLMYLHYLPFCEVFASGDKLHRTCTPAFLRGDQDFLWAPDMKAALGRANAYYAAFPEEVKERGILSFADSHPEKDDPYLAPLWDKHRPGWRERNGKPIQLSPEANRNLAEYILSRKPQQPDAATFAHRYPPTRGRWRVIPKDLPKNG